MVEQLTFWDLEEKKESSPLHIYTNEMDYVIAESSQEACEIMMHESGLDEEEAGEFHQYPDGADFTMHGYSPDENRMKKAREWCLEHGKGYFASSEW